MGKKLTTQQKEAIEFFEKHGYLVVDASRRSGKTTILKEIIRKNPEKNFGIVCKHGYPSYKQQYGELENCKYMASIDEYTKNKYDIILGDEKLITPQMLEKKRYPTACVMTTPFVVKTIENRASDKELKEFKKEIPQEMFESEFGQYIY